MLNPSSKNGKSIAHLKTYYEMDKSASSVITNGAALQKSSLYEKVVETKSRPNP